MPDFLRDPAWQFVGVIIALLAIIVTIAIYLVGKNKKSLSYEILSKTPLLSIEDEIKGKLQILFDGASVSKVYLIVIRLTNTGNTPIITADYEREVSIQLSENSKVLNAEISDTNPENLLASLGISDHNISMKPILLNKGDTVTIKALVGGFEGTIKMDCRIVGVKNIELKKDSYLSTVVMFMGLLIFGFGMVFSQREQSNATDHSPLYIFSFIGYIISGIGVVTISTIKRLWRAGHRIFRALLNKKA